ncbi:MAG: DUF4412 domain-containing protein [Chromatiales bacterium]
MRPGKWPFVILVAGLCLAVGIFLTVQMRAGKSFEGKIVQKKLVIPLSIFPPDEAENNPEIAQKLFEIPIDVLRKMTAEKGERILEHTVTMYVKANRSRVDAEQNGQTTSVIRDMDSGSLITLQRASRTATVRGIDRAMPVGDQASAQPGKNGDTVPEEERFLVQAAGTSNVINGYRCELYQGVNRAGDYIQLWLTRDVSDLPEGLIPVFAQLLNIAPIESATVNEREFFVTNRGIPVLVQSITPAELEIQQTVEISRQDISDGLFEIPEDFKEIDL